MQWFIGINEGCPAWRQYAEMAKVAIHTALQHTSLQPHCLYDGGENEFTAWLRRRDIPKTPWFLRAVAVSGVAAIVALECGWIVTEVGRQPWIVYNVMRTEDAVTQADGVWVTFAAVVLLYAVLGGALVVTLRAMSRRWRAAGEDDSEVPYGPSPEVPPATLAEGPQ